MRPPADVLDLERSLARINAAGQGVGSARDAPHVVLYEDVAKKRVQVRCGCLVAVKTSSRVSH